jgi:hypothetical protein
VTHQVRTCVHLNFTSSSVDVRTRMRPRSVHVTYINCITNLPCAISMIDFCFVCIQCSRWHAPFTCMARFVMIDSFTAHTRHQPCNSTNHWTPVVCCSLHGHSVCCSHINNCIEILLARVLPLFSPTSLASSFLRQGVTWHATRYVGHALRHGHGSTPS